MLRAHTRSVHDRCGTPFQRLSGVSLGMTARELKALRPHLRLSPYYGLSESTDSLMVAYQFEVGGASESDIDAGSRLIMVTITKTAGSIDSARTRWMDELPRIAARFGHPSRCSRLLGNSPGMSASWQV